MNKQIEREMIKAYRAILISNSNLRIVWRNLNCIQDR